MFLDARRVEPGKTLDCDICIVGGGAAGITLAREFNQNGMQVILLESGALRYNKKTQALYKGENTGLHYELDTTRTRYFGGSTNCWGGWCRPLSEMDFSQRKWVANSGWPIPRSELEPYYQRAHAVANVLPGEYDPERWLARQKNPNLSILRFASNRVETRIAQLSPCPRFGREYREELKQSDNVRLFFNANITGFRANPNGTQIERVDVACLNRNHFSVTAKTFVLATGGIENARLLLLSNDVQKEGLGNQHDLVGRFFMEHPRIVTGEIEFFKDIRPDLYDTGYAYFNSPVIASLALSPDTQRQEQLLNYHAYIEAMYEGEDSEGARELKDLYIKLRRGEIPERFVSMTGHILRDLPQVYKYFKGKRLRAERYMRTHKLVNILEPEPNPESRITLSNARDALGLQQVRMNWMLTPKVHNTLLRSQQIIGEELERAGIGRLKIDPALEAGEWGGPVEWVWHHMGSTRMDPDPRKGVVDTDCKLHGVSNLYVAGSSVYPTVSADTPTLTVIALALRIADHIKNKMKSGHSVAT